MAGMSAARDYRLANNPSGRYVYLMTLAHHRPKQPDLLRQQVLAAAVRLAVEKGAEAVTLDAVARRAGVSKGGLQHHFPGKRALIDALFDRMWQRFSAELAAEMAADPEPRGRAARAYIQVGTRGLPDEEGDFWRAALTLMLADPTLRERWSAWVRQAWQADLAAEADVTTLLVCRLAADGLWLSDLAGYDAVPPARRADVVQALVAMTYAKETPR